MPIDSKKFEQIVTEHFATVTDEEFLENLRKSSPYLFVENSEATTEVHSSDTPDLTLNNSPAILDRQNLAENQLDRYSEFVNSLNLSPETSKNTELYQQAKQEIKLEIAPKLLKKGMSIQEVAELLELDVHLLAQ